MKPQHPSIDRRKLLAGALAAGLGSMAGPALAQGTPSFSPRQFGAVGDGIADDTRAVQQAADAASRARGGLVFPRGQVFGIRDYVYIRDGVRSVSGGGTLRILRSATQQCALVGAGRASGNATNLRNCIFRDFTFDANHMNSTGIYCQNSQNCGVVGVRVINNTAGVGILFKSFAAGGEPGRGNYVENCVVESDPDGAVLGTCGISFDSEIDYGRFNGQSNPQRLFWRANFRAAAPRLQERDGRITDCELRGGYYGVAIGAHGMQIDRVTCIRNTRGLSLQNHANANRLSRILVRDCLSSAILIAYGSSDNHVEDAEANTTRANGEALFQSIIGAQRNVFSGARGIVRGSTAPQYYFYCAVQSDGCAFVDVHASGPAANAYLGIESGWSSQVRNPAHRAMAGAGRELDNFARAGMTGIEVRGLTIDGGSRVPAIFIGQITDSLGAHALDDIIVDETAIRGSGFSTRLQVLEMTRGSLRRRQ